MQPLYPDTLSGARPAEALEACLDAIERHLSALGAALRDRNGADIEAHAADLQRALANAVHRFAHASRQQGGIPQALRQRLALASGQVAAQRDCLARATAALDRAMDVLMPQAQPPGSVYDNGGHNDRAASSGCLHA